MQTQRVTRVGGVRERYVPGVGATPALRTCRVGSAALVAPTPGTSSTNSGPNRVPNTARFRTSSKPEAVPTSARNKAQKGIQI